MWQLLSTVVLLGVFIGVVLGMPFVSVLLARRWPGNWRRLAFLPLLALGLVVLNITIGVVIDPTAHNLWPFEIVMVTVGGWAYLGVLALARRVVERKPGGARALLSHPVVGWAAVALGLFLIAQGVEAIRADAEQRGDVAAIVIGVVVIYWALTGRIPRGFRPRWRG